MTESHTTKLADRATKFRAVAAKLEAGYPRQARAFSEAASTLERSMTCPCCDGIGLIWVPTGQLDKKIIVTCERCVGKGIVSDGR